MMSVGRGNISERRQIVSHYTSRNFSIRLRAGRVGHVQRVLLKPSLGQLQYVVVLSTGNVTCLVVSDPPRAATIPLSIAETMYQ